MQSAADQSGRASVGIAAGKRHDARPVLRHANEPLELPMLLLNTKLPDPVSAIVCAAAGSKHYVGVEHDGVGR